MLSMPPATSSSASPAPIACAASMTAFSPEPHTLLTVKAAMRSGTPAVPAVASHWPGWRGPHGDGHSPEKQVLLRWSATENIRWKVALPDEGNSSPIVWGQRIFVTQATEKVDWPPAGAGGPASAYRRGL